MMKNLLTVAILATALMLPVVCGAQATMEDLTKMAIDGTLQEQKPGAILTNDGLVDVHDYQDDCLAYMLISADLKTLGVACGVEYDKEVFDHHGDWVAVYGQGRYCRDVLDSHSHYSWEAGFGHFTQLVWASSKYLGSDSTGFGHFTQVVWNSSPDAGSVTTAQDCSEGLYSEKTSPGERDTWLIAYDISKYIEQEQDSGSPFYAVFQN